MEKSISFRFQFCLFCADEYDVEKITEILKIEPTKKWVKDKSNPKPLYRDESGWEKSSIEIFNAIFDESFLSFFKEFEAVISKIKELEEKDNLSCKIYVIVNIYEGSTMPGIYIDQKILSALSFINCSLDFDMYDFRENIVR